MRIVILRATMKKITLRGSQKILSRDTKKNCKQYSTQKKERKKVGKEIKKIIAEIKVIVVSKK